MTIPAQTTPPPIVVAVAGCRAAIRSDDAVFARLFSGQSLMADVLSSLNSGQLAQRRFREIARVAGLPLSVDMARR